MPVLLRIDQDSRPEIALLETAGQQAWKMPEAVGSRVSEYVRLLKLPTKQPPTRYPGEFESEIAIS